ncbi:bifunctional MaoC family dehydratase N-terminal/OB-fold nucleic acid binding domain-containing protein [Gordonia jacobaea]|uniref:bifunctional MaoC family dehydratase N-terminal/OB-fold nucleic acid binding domain-containing protein n=1 Tax=Gordonia jacobaea TaxID=122202 RepID=UPI003D706B7F
MSDIRTAAQAIIDAGPSAPTLGRDPVNTPMINNWVEAIGDTNPVYVDADAARAAGHSGIVAPPAMAQVWTMRGLNGQRTADDPLGRASELFDEAGYTSVVATNCDTTYHRYLDVGEQVSLSAELVDVVGPKQTALGEGWFFTTRNTWSVDDEVVAEMDFRILKFRPHDDVAPRDAGAGDVPSDLDPSRMLRPSASRDTEFFWEGIAAHELRIQKLDDGTLRHPPIPATWKPRQPDGTVPVTDYVVASGTGTVYSYVVHRAPKVPGRALPFVVALVELDGFESVDSGDSGDSDDDGLPLSSPVRLLAELRDVDPADVHIGQRVEAMFLDFPADEESGTDAWTLHAWRPTTQEAQ